MLDFSDLWSPSTHLPVYDALDYLADALPRGDLRKEILALRDQPDMDYDIRAELLKQFGVSPDDSDQAEEVITQCSKKWSIKRFKSWINHPSFEVFP